MTATHPAPATETWDAQLEQLRTRYKHVRPPVLAALNILISDPNISIGDAKAQADRRGVRITAASINAAKPLMSRMDTLEAATAATTKATAGTPTRAPRRPRAADAAVDAETLIKGVVAKLQNQSGAEADRVRDGIRRAITILQGLVG